MAENFEKILKEEFTTLTASLVGRRRSLQLRLASIEAGIDVSAKRIEPLKRRIEDLQLDKSKGDETVDKKLDLAQKELIDHESSLKVAEDLRKKIADLDAEENRIGEELTRRKGVEFADELHKRIEEVFLELERAYISLRDFPYPGLSGAQLNRIFALSSSNKKTKALRARVERWL